MQFFPFDKAYLERLRSEDASTEGHFVAYFGELLKIKLRARMLPPDRVNDVSQETFLRVFKAVRKEDAIREPDRLGAFVNSICDNVLREKQRNSFRDQPVEDCHFEIQDKKVDLEGMLDAKRLKERIRQILRQMPKRDRDVLQAIFLEEKEKDEVCREFDVDRGYLRVIVHRAKDRFRSLYEQGPPGQSSGGR